MSKCKYCGKDAGFLRSAHKECGNAFEKGKTEVEGLLFASARGKLSLPVAEADIKNIVRSSYIDEMTYHQSVMKCFEQAIDMALNDDLLSEEEETYLDNYVDCHKLDKGQLSSNPSYLRLVKAGILRDLLEGNFPERIVIDGSLPINLQKSEKIIWVFQDVDYLQPRTRTTYEGRSSGVSIRVMKGIYYRTGQFKGNPVQTTQIVPVDTGILAVTNKHLYFVGSTKTQRIPFSKIIAYQPYSDAISISREGVLKQDIFRTNDGWFTYNLISNLASIT
ncbi:MAG TPA: hypothetical protein PKE20_02655 [Promineifilum sp.]|nr:hypothetical protein [Promineifilum sp.]